MVSKCQIRKINKGMMKFKLIAFLFTIALVFNSCYKDNFEFTPDEDPEVIEKGKIADFFSQVPNDFDSLSFNAEQGIIFATENETVIEIYAGSFVDGSGELVTGEVDLKYIEVLNPAEYALYGLPTIADKKRLRSEGVFRFEARKEGKELKFKEGKSVTVRLPVDEVESGMQLFEGAGSGEDFTWVTAEDLGGTDTDFFQNEWSISLNVNQEIVDGFGYQFTCDLFTWINVDIFADIPESEKTTVCVELPEKYTNENTIIFMLFNDSKSILALYPDTDKMKWCEPYGATPKGSKVTFIVISSQGGGVFHFALQEATIQEEHVEFITPEEKSFDDIIEAIKNL